MSPGFFFCKIATPWKRDDDPKRQLFQSPRVTVLDSGLQTKKGFLRNRIYVGCGLLTATGTRNISFSVRDLCKPSFSHETMRICPVVCKELRSSDWFVVFDWFHLESNQSLWQSQPPDRAERPMGGKRNLLKPLINQSSSPSFGKKNIPQQKINSPFPIGEWIRFSRLEWSWISTGQPDLLFVQPLQWSLWQTLNY